MEPYVALFGEAERGKHRKLHEFNSLIDFAETLGNPPKDSQGISLGIQALLFERNILFYKVMEEGFSKDDYLYGMNLLTSADDSKQITALCLPGVGDQDIINHASTICNTNHSLLITTEKDFYDYLTESYR